MSETLVIKSDFERFDAWREAFSRIDLAIVPWSERHSVSGIEYALVWQPPPGSLAELKNLQVIFSVGAGLDHLAGGNILPAGIPVIRMVEPGLTAGMVEYVLYWVLHFHRYQHIYRQQQLQHSWRGIMQIPAHERRVAILGLGELGSACAQALVRLGFKVSGWSRSRKSIPGVHACYGEDVLYEMVSTCDFVVCLLPLTPATRGILDARLFSAMPKGSYLINAGRGECQIEADIVEALESGHLGGAALDVFTQEPLSRQSPLWLHPNVSITPHIASMSLPDTCARHVMDNIRRYRMGQEMSPIADMTRGY